VFSRADVRCYGTAEAANQAIGMSSPPSGDVEPNALSDCQSGWFCLWDGKNFTGRRLQFNHEYWDNLTPYGFNDKTSSIYNRQSSGDTAGLGENDAGTGGWQDWYSAGTRVSDLGTDHAQWSHDCRLCP
jgi:Peptidase inhibitor family I36